MLNQIRRIWNDTGSEDKDFTSDELKLKQALQDLKDASDQMSRASTVLLDLIHSQAAPVSQEGEGSGI